MSTSNSAPYGLKTLLECMSRAVLLAQPDDIAGFLSTHMEEMVRYREKNIMTDIKDNQAVMANAKRLAENSMDSLLQIYSDTKTSEKLSLKIWDLNS
uniref:RIIa domain-containing protein n=1 Tax=Mola mola TaxID=94237 RepID=A0A3Q3WPZ4_MOLML